MQLHDVSIHRIWAGGSGRVWFELSLELSLDGQKRRCLLQGGCSTDLKHRGDRNEPRLTEHGLMGLRIYDRAAGLWICTPDRDPKVRAIKKLLSRNRIGALLEGTRAADDLKFEPSSSMPRVEIVAYRASKRCVLRLTTTHEGKPNTIFAKAFKRARREDELEVLRRLDDDLQGRGGGMVRIPPITGHLPKDRLTFVTAVPQPCVRLRTSGDDLTLAARLLSLLHSSTITVSRTHGVDDELASLRRRMRELQALQLPYELFEQLVPAIEAAMGCIGGPGHSLVHGAFHTAPVLKSRGQLWLLDLETLAHGHAEVDLAKFVARLLYSSKNDGSWLTPGWEKAQFFLGQYRAVEGQVNEAAIRFFLVCAMAKHGASELTKGRPQEHVDRYWRVAQEIALGTRLPL